MAYRPKAQLCFSISTQKPIQLKKTCVGSGGSGASVLRFLTTLIPATGKEIPKNPSIHTTDFISYFQHSSLYLSESTVFCIYKVLYNFHENLLLFTYNALVGIVWSSDLTINGVTGGSSQELCG